MWNRPNIWGKGCGQTSYAEDKLKAKRKKVEAEDKDNVRKPNRDQDQNYEVVASLEQSGARGRSGHKALIFAFSHNLYQTHADAKPHYKLNCYCS